MATAYAANSTVDSAITAAGGVDMDVASNTGRKPTRRVPIPISVERPTDESTGYPVMLSSSPQTSPRIELPIPNPPFVFPARPSSSSAPTSLSKASGRRPRSAVESQDRGLSFGDDMTGFRSPGTRQSRSPALPDFSFNPAAQLDPETIQPKSPTPLPDFSYNPGATLGPDGALLSPPMSPSSPRLIPSHPSRRHQRGGSEFVGGNIRTGDSITVMSTSPTKSEGGFASPNLAPIDTSNPRRRGPGGPGHRHRRSAAISSHDLTMILNPSSPNPSRGSSAPTTPADFDEKVSPFSDTSNDQSKPAEPAPEIAAVEKVPESPVDRVDPSRSANSSPTKAVPRARVGFSDTLEFIPRPLSMVSTDTASTATVRPSHSVSGSISSIISLSNSVTTAERDSPSPAIFGSPAYGRNSDSRPSTAGAVLERTPSVHSIAVGEGSPSPRRRNSTPLLAGLPVPNPTSPATPSPTKTPKRWSFFGFEALAAAGTPTRARAQSSSSSDSASKPISLGGLPSEEISESAIDDSEPPAETKKSTGKKKKPKKVKNWAGSILTRKPKSRSQKAKAARRRSQTPPLPRVDVDQDMDDDSADASEHMKAPVVTVTEPLSPPREYGATKSRANIDDDTTYPMIDLDAALGPFNTPSSRDAAWEEAQRSGTPQKRQLHSAVGMRGFSGPGMHYHRRAESAPEMPPFEGGRFIHRFGSSSTMADVFEEDEEDDGESMSSSEESTPEASGASAIDFDAQSTADDVVSTPTREFELSVKSSRESFSLANSVKRKGSGSSLDMQPPGSRMRTETSSNSLHEEVIAEEPPIRQAADQGRIYEPFSDLADVAVSPRRVIANKDLSPVEIHPINLQAPSMMPTSPYSASHSSSFPSPLSPMSYDAHRVSTAPSSVTEENNFQSLLMGEPGPEVIRISVDVPSLTSSNSTMTRESNYPGVRPRNLPFHDQRPASFTSTAFGRRRSSLASLSRLISSAHGERSKLSMEVPAESDSEKKPKAGKTKRLSRLMKFFKPKEATGS